MLKTHIIDGEGSGLRVGVTGSNALKVRVIEGSAADQSEAELTAQRAFRGFLENGVSKDLNVDGSTTPVEFMKASEPQKAIWVTGIRVILHDQNMDMSSVDSQRFGSATATKTPLPNGLELFASQGGEQIDLYTIPIVTIASFLNDLDEFLNIVDGVDTNVDFLSTTIKLDVPVVLPAGSADKLIMRVNDDLTAVNFFQVVLRGYQETI